MAASHLGLRTPAKPGVTTRSGKPCFGLSVSPFMAVASSTSGAIAFSIGIEAPKWKRLPSISTSSSEAKATW